jgi:hypothetical protein
LPPAKKAAGEDILLISLRREGQEGVFAESLGYPQTRARFHPNDRRQRQNETDLPSAAAYTAGGNLP